MKQTMISSNVMSATPRGNHGHFKVRQIGFRNFEDIASPVLNIDHYTMTERTFQPHPHAGFSAITYMFEWSKAGLRNKDSKGDDSIIAPGDLHWTLAGSGIIHDEFPEKEGTPSEGIQLFVNLHPQHKLLDPKVYKLASQDAPRAKVNGVTVKVVTGKFGDLESPVKLPERFDFFDIEMLEDSELRINAFKNSGGIIYVIDGEATVSTETESKVAGGQYLAIRLFDADALITIKVKRNSKILYLRGEHDDAPLVSYGPFIMNNPNEIEKTIERYKAGKMGYL